MQKQPDGDKTRNEGFALDLEELNYFNEVRISAFLLGYCSQPHPTGDKRSLTSHLGKVKGQAQNKVTCLVFVGAQHAHSHDTVFQTVRSSTIGSCTVMCCTVCRLRQFQHLWQAGMSFGQ